MHKDLAGEVLNYLFVYKLQLKKFRSNTQDTEGLLFLYVFRVQDKNDGIGKTWATNENKRSVLRI